MISMNLIDLFFLYFVPVCVPGIWIIATFLEYTQDEDFREKLFIANFLRVFVKFPHNWIYDLSILENKNCEIDIGKTRVIVLY